MDAQSVLRLLGKKEEAVKASKALLDEKERFYTLRRERQDEITRQVLELISARFTVG
jgi:hypothetical protein